MEPKEVNLGFVEGFDFQRVIPEIYKGRQLELFGLSTPLGVSVYRSSWDFGRGLRWVRVAWVSR